jgi:hypothetical protein
MNETLDKTKDYVHYYLTLLRQGEEDMAFAGLIDGGPGIVPRLIEGYRNEVSTRVKSELLEIIAQYRLTGTESFFYEALMDPSSEIWKAGLDGLVRMGTPIAKALLQASMRQAHCGARDEALFKKWVVDALDNIPDNSGER